MRHSLSLLQVYPKGQQALSPHFGSSRLKTLVLICASGCFSGSCTLRSQVIGLILSHFRPCGQHRAVVPPASAWQTVFAGQQKLEGLLDGQEIWSAVQLSRRAKIWLAGMAVDVVANSPARRIWRSCRGSRDIVVASGLYLCRIGSVNGIRFVK